MTTDRTLPETHAVERESFKIFRSFVDDKLAAGIVKEALSSHTRACDSGEIHWDGVAESKTSFKLEFGIRCGGDLTESLPLAASTIRDAFQRASEQFDNPTLTAMANSKSRLTGLSLLYGLQASMSSHYDSPTQPGQREEWLAMISLGNTALFRCNKQVLRVNSGDVLVMDSMAVLHGVEGIVVEEQDNIHASVGLPIPCRLGVLFWQAKDEVASTEGLYEEIKEVELGGLFGDSDED